MRIVLLDLAEQAADGLAHRAGPQRTSARSDGRAHGFREARGNVFGHKYQRPDETKILLPRIGDRRQSADAAREHRIAQERFAKIIRRVSEGNYVGPQPASDFINGPAPEPAAQVAPVIGLFFQQPERWIVGVIRPVDAASLQVFAQRLDGPQKLALLHGKRAHGKLDGRALGEQQHRFEQRQRVLAA